MSHLYRPRVGWEGERLAHYLLSRFSFVAQPTTIADDVGSDFYCTIFEVTEGEPPMIDPRTSFAIQIKTNKARIEAHNKIDFLKHLEIPFFIGIVNQTTAELRIYSGEQFPLMSAVFGYREQLWLQPVEERNGPLYEGTPDGLGAILHCPYVCSFSAGETRNDLRPKVEQLLHLCQRIVGNIGTRRAQEHIYQLDDTAHNYLIVAGVGSITKFRDNMYKRLAEAFYNFEFILNNAPELFDVAEFKAYETFFLSLLQSHRRDSLILAAHRYNELKRMVDRRFPTIQQ